MEYGSHIWAWLLFTTFILRKVIFHVSHAQIFSGTLSTTHSPLFLLPPHSLLPSHPPHFSTPFTLLQAHSFSSDFCHFSSGLLKSQPVSSILIHTCSSQGDFFKPKIWCSFLFKFRWFFYLQIFRGNFRINSNLLITVYQGNSSNSSLNPKNGIKSSKIK